MTDDERQREYRDADWLRDAVWQWQAYQKSNRSWNREHCVFCWRRIAEADYGDADALQEAWTTTCLQPEGDAGYEWVCPDCFRELKDTFRWRTVETRDTAA